MTNILVGPKVSDHIITLSRKLKSSAIDQFRAKGKDINQYIPWIAAGSDIDFDFPEELFKHPAIDSRGSFLNTPAYLEAARSYLLVALPKISHHRGLLPGALKDWLPEAITDATCIENVNAGIKMLRSLTPSFEALYNELVEFVLPVGDVHRGYSNCDVRGVIFRGFPKTWNAYDVAIDVAHELGHHSLYVWQSIDKILTSPTDEQIYSSVRKDYRPAIQSFHGAVALAFMLQATQNWEKNEVSEEVRIRHGKFYVGGTLETALDEAINTLKEKCTFTAVGSKMLDEMSALLQKH